ncbi:MAG TPA: response regulator [Pseudonocardiaceae bacterium]|nr:response regulator [Pseudonocardiaceae bacterium]
MSQTISAIASLLWPLIVLAVLVLFRGPLTRVIRSTESRDFTIKIAGQEVSVGELHRQQMDMLADLQDQIAALHKEAGIADQPGPAKITSRVTVDSPVTVAAGQPGGTATADFDDTDTELTHVELPSQDRPQFHADPVKAPWERLEHHDPEPVEEPAAAAAQATTLTIVQSDDAEIVPGWAGQPADSRPKAAGVLWVDDHPERNALQVDQLERRGVVVDAVRSTKEAVQKLTGQRYQIIVSDMERVEGGKPVPNAGLELIRTIRTFDRDTPVVIFASGPGGKVLADTAAQIGADLVTNSWYQLSQEMRRIGVL